MSADDWDAAPWGDDVPLEQRAVAERFYRLRKALRLSQDSFAAASKLLRRTEIVLVEGGGSLAKVSRWIEGVANVAAVKRGTADDYIRGAIDLAELLARRGEGTLSPPDQAFAALMEWATATKGVRLALKEHANDISTFDVLRLHASPPSSDDPSAVYEHIVRLRGGDLTANPVTSDTPAPSRSVTAKGVPAVALESAIASADRKPKRPYATKAALPPSPRSSKSLTRKRPTS